MIPYSKQDINDDDIAAVVKVLKSPFVTQGPTIKEFEAALAKYSGTKHAVVFNSGTSALHAAYFAAGVGPGDEVVVPALTFAATANCALYLGAKPVFTDVDPKLGTMSVASAKKVITKRTKALVPVDYGGRPVDVAALKAIAKKNKIVLIIDGAQSLGASYKGKPVGSQGDMTMFSFHPVKSITSAEGGAITTDSDEYATALRLFRSHGITTDPAYLERKDQGAWYQEMQALGFNYRMTEMQAALGLNQMKRLDTFVTKRRAVANRYHKALANVAGIILPKPDSAQARSAWHLYPIRVTDTSIRNDVLNKLRAAGIFAHVHHLPVHRHLYYEKLGYKEGICPDAEHFVSGEISIPIYPGMTTKDQGTVVRTLKSIMASYMPKKAAKKRA
jgi:UDP-4-amino-4,6-dideoxy-N-acetyl-beta-L-altrosamine transaminase